jgi:predicted dehydrogenase
VIGAAAIAKQHVIPALQRGRYASVVALASRDARRADTTAAQLGIGAAYGSYEALLADPNVDAVYIPLPNHLHVPWSIRALEAGKHVLCEKPIALSAQEAMTLVDAASAHPRLKVMEAFMYRFHPQWQRARALVETGAIGDVRAVHTWFSYFNDDPANVRNSVAAGGGALMDIGCYGVSVARFIFGREPTAVSAARDVDPRFGTDRLTAAVLTFGPAIGTFTCATQLIRHQRVDIVGTTGRIEIAVPFNPPADRPSRIWVQGHAAGGPEEIVLEPCNQYTIQGDLFSAAIMNDSDVPTPMTDAVANMSAIDAVTQSATRGAPTSVQTC